MSYGREQLQLCRSLLQSCGLPDGCPPFLHRWVSMVRELITFPVALVECASPPRRPSAHTVLSVSGQAHRSRSWTVRPSVLKLRCWFVYVTDCTPSHELSTVEFVGFIRIMFSFYGPIFPTTGIRCQSIHNHKTTSHLYVWADSSRRLPNSISRPRVYRVGVDLMPRSSWSTSRLFLHYRPRDWSAPADRLCGHFWRC